MLGLLAWLPCTERHFVLDSFLSFIPPFFLALFLPLSLSLFMFLTASCLLSFVYSHVCLAHLLPQHGRAILGQPLPQLRQPSHEADDCSTHCESMHAKVHGARLAAGVDCQAEVALPTGCLEHLQHAQEAPL